MPCSEAQLGAGWRLGQLPLRHDVYDPADLARDAVRDTAAPALALHVVDSDYAEVSCDSPASVRHTFLLNPDALLDYVQPWDPQPAPPPPPTVTVPVLRRWAAEAGLNDSPAALAAALATSPGPFGEGVHALAEALGVPRPPT